MVLPLTWTVNCDAPITVARMRWPGSMSGSVVRRLNSAASSCRQQRGDVAVFLRLVTEDVFGDAAREREGRRGDRPRQRLGQPTARWPSGSEACTQRCGRPRPSRDGCAMAWRTDGSVNVVGSIASPTSFATSRAESSTRVQVAFRHRWQEAVRRPRRRTGRAPCRGRSAQASSCRRRYRHGAGIAPRSATGGPRRSPERRGALPSMWPAVAQTNLPASSANSSSIARAFFRLIASPVRITAPLSISLRAQAGLRISVVDEACERVRHRWCRQRRTASA